MHMAQTPWGHCIRSDVEHVTMSSMPSLCWSMGSEVVRQNRLRGMREGVHPWALCSHSPSPYRCLHMPTVQLLWLPPL
jgi:hypothetical protein